jgi:hypothetical protein
MGSPQIRFATCAKLPVGSDDDRLVLQELQRRGLSAGASVWDDPEVPWGASDLVVLRSTWDYMERPGAFLDWVDRTARQTRLWNPAVMVRWNAHKSYLLELASAGIAIVPTELVPRGSGTALRQVLDARGWTDAMIKPAIGANASRSRRVSSAEVEDAEPHLRSLLEDGEALVQPFQHRTSELGERSIVFIDGTFAHAVRYASNLVENPRRPVDFVPTESHLAAARHALTAARVRPLYARLDYLPDEDGEWRLGELELIEPELFFRGHPESVRRFTDACEARLADPR